MGAEGCVVPWSLTPVYVCVITTTIRLQNSFITQNTASCHLFPITIPHPQRYSSWHSLVCHYILIILRCCKWGYKVSDVWRLDSSTQLNALEIQGVCSFLQYRWVTFHSTVWMDAPCFIQSLSETRLDYFWFEAIINKAILDFYLHVSVFIILISGAHHFFF